jgi:hypothetical protein
VIGINTLIKHSLFGVCFLFIACTNNSHPGKTVEIVSKQDSSNSFASQLRPYFQMIKNNDINQRMIDSILKVRSLHIPETSIAPIILHLQIRENSLSPLYDLEKTEINMNCIVLNVLKGTKIKIGDTILWSHTVYVTPEQIKTDTLEKLMKSDKIKVGKEFFVFLKPRKKDAIDYGDSIFVHLKGGYIEKEFQGKPIMIEKSEEYKMVKLFR